MSTRIVGKVVDENGIGLDRLRVSLRVPGAFLAYDGFELGAGATRNGGDFEFTYENQVSDPRQLLVLIEDSVGRELLRSDTFNDVNTDPLVFDDDFEVPKAEVSGFKVTLGTGAPARVSSGNAVTWLMDTDAFTAAAELINDATEQILLSQLFFPVPPSFDAAAGNEVTKLVMQFHDNAPTAAAPRAADDGDKRPERLLLLVADKGVDVRVLLHDFEVPLFLQLLIGALVFPFVRSVGRELLRDDFTDADEVKRYFGQSGSTNIQVEAFTQPVLTAGVLHAKLIVVDGRHALSIGSPFGQAYVDTHDHEIDAPRRGQAGGFPMHDAGFKVTGPAVGDLHDTWKLLWDTASSTPVPALVNPPSPETTGGDGVCTMQLVRTLSAGRFTGQPEGEKGILEGYLRAIALAEQFIYLETQYFTNDAIGRALVEAMKRKPALQVIVVCPIRPDLPFYPFKQRRLITRIRKGIGQTPEGPQRFGVFTRWTHQVDQPRPRMLPVYIHAKLGIVDNSWATVGSANLDGLSLDSSLVSDVFHIPFDVREQRAIEVNGLVFNGHGEPTTEVVDVLRRKVWAEHLGFSSGGVLDITHPDLRSLTLGGWLELWAKRSDATLRQLQDHPAQSIDGMARVLPWPTDDETHKTPRKHLEALDIKSFKVVPLKSTREFDLETGRWKPDSKAQMDYP